MAGFAFSGDFLLLALLFGTFWGLFFYFFLGFWKANPSSLAFGLWIFCYELGGSLLYPWKPKFLDRQLWADGIPGAKSHSPERFVHPLGALQQPQEDQHKKNPSPQPHQPSKLQQQQQQQQHNSSRSSNTTITTTATNTTTTTSNLIEHEATTKIVSNGTSRTSNNRFYAKKKQKHRCNRRTKNDGLLQSPNQPTKQTNQPTKQTKSKSQSSLMAKIR